MYPMWDVFTALHVMTSVSPNDPPSHQSNTIKYLPKTHTHTLSVVLYSTHILSRFALTDAQQNVAAYGVSVTLSQGSYRLLPKMIENRVPWKKKVDLVSLQPARCQSRPDTALHSSTLTSSARTQSLLGFMAPRINSAWRALTLIGQNQENDREA